MKIYQANIEKYNDKALRLQKLLNRISLLRLFTFVISITILILLISFNLVAAAFIVLAISIICFAFVLKHHNEIAYLRQHISFLKKINESEIQREKCNLEELDTGHQFKNRSHPYTSDLDIFGQHSIFQLINRTTTESGMTLLSKWLSRSEEHTSELQSRGHLVCRLLLEKKKKNNENT